METGLSCDILCEFTAVSVSDKDLTTFEYSDRTLRRSHICSRSSHAGKTYRPLKKHPVTRFPPIAFLHDLRLETAREMLADPTCFLLIKEIGLEVGLENDSHFTQDFKAKNGMTPTDYRQQQSEIYQSDPPDGQE
ncbi:MAG: helix-turn-helix domain-containing protein [Pyrinomonadaceae bacterium]